MSSKLMCNFNKRKDRLLITAPEQASCGLRLNWTRVEIRDIDHKRDDYKPHLPPVSSMGVCAYLCECPTECVRTHYNMVMWKTFE